MTSELLFIGPFPPPMHGQSMATAELYKKLTIQSVPLAVLDLSLGRTWHQKLVLYLRATVALLGGRGSAYISVASNRGIWLTLLLALACRLRGRRTFLHYHAFGPLIKRPQVVAMIGWALGEYGHHVVLGPAMASCLRDILPKPALVRTLNNSGLIEPGSPKGSRRSGPIVLGHLSNLSLEKGLDCVVAAAIAAAESGLDIKLLIAGPCTDARAQSVLADARNRLGERVEYMGAIYGQDKGRFYTQLDVFLFPTKYINEASPLVLFEAMSNDVPCIATDVGCIEDDLAGVGGLTVSLDEFSQAVVRVVSALAHADTVKQFNPRRRYTEMVEQYQSQLTDLVAAMRP